MVIRTLKNSEKKAYYDLLWYCHPEPKQWHDIEEQYFNPNEGLVVVDDQDRINTALQIRSFTMAYYGFQVPMGGIACVASSPDTRYQGHTGKLMQASIERMHDMGMVFCALTPFNYNFYRKYGWELSYERMHYKLDMATMQKFLKTDYSYSLDVEANREAFIALHNDFMSAFQGAALLDSALFKRRMDILQAFDYSGCMCMNPEGEPEGYILYRKQKEDFIIREIMWRTVPALKALLGFAYRHNAECHGKVIIQVPKHNLIMDILDEYSGEIIHRPDMMMRVIDVKAALEKRKYHDDLRAQLSIQIEDAQAPWNEGTWLLTIKGGTCSVMRVESVADVSMDIKAFTQMMMGFRNASELSYLHRIHTASIPMVTRLDEIFPKSHTYLTERF